MKTEMMCPNCEKGLIREQVSIKKRLINNIKEIIYYCPLCEWENKKVFTLSKDDIEREKMERINEKAKPIERYKEKWL